MDRESQEITCKNCEYYEFYDGPERTADGKKAIMFCREKKRLGCYEYYGNIDKCSNFTPKKPKEPEPKKVRKQCLTCRYSHFNNETREGCGIAFPEINKKCDHYSEWKPVEKPEEQEKPKNGCSECIHWDDTRVSLDGKANWCECMELYTNFSTHCTEFTPKEPKEPEKPKKSCGTCKYLAISGRAEPCNSCSGWSNYSNWKPKEPKVKKEKTMLKKVKHVIRMAGTLWLLYGMSLVIIYLYPWIRKGIGYANSCLFGVINLAIKYDVEQVVDGETIMVPHTWDAGNQQHIFYVWAISIASVCFAFLAIYSLHRFSIFYWRPRKES